MQWQLASGGDRRVPARPHGEGAGRRVDRHHALPTGAPRCFSAWCCGGVGALWSPCRSPTACRPVRDAAGDHRRRGRDRWRTRPIAGTPPGRAGGRRPDGHTRPAEAAMSEPEGERTMNTVRFRFSPRSGERSLVPAWSTGGLMLPTIPEHRMSEPEGERTMNTVRFVSRHAVASAHWCPPGRRWLDVAHDSGAPHERARRASERSTRCRLSRHAVARAHWCPSARRWRVARPGHQ